MANITWDSANKSSSVTISGGTATNGLGNNAGVMATSGQATGKYYFEVTLGDTPGANSRIGVAPNYFVPGSTGTTKWTYININAASIDFVVNAINAANQTVTCAAGTVLCLALDLDNQMIWFRANALNWNNSGTANPATNTGGFSLTSSLGTKGISLIPLVFFSLANHAVTANFGDAAFAQTVPSGFTAGIPAGGANNALFTQEVAEAWGASFPSQAQFTQETVEVWRSVADFVAPPSTGGAFVMMLS